jgi:hypothetical protein
VLGPVQWARRLLKGGLRRQGVGSGYLVFSPPAPPDDKVNGSGKRTRGFLFMNFLISHRTRKTHHQNPPLL